MEDADSFVPDADDVLVSISVILPGALGCGGGILSATGGAAGCCFRARASAKVVTIK